MDLEVLADVVGLNRELASALKSQGWKVTKVGALNGMEVEVKDSIRIGLELVTPGLLIDPSDLDDMIQAADAAAQTVWSVHGGLRDTDLALAHRMKKSQERLTEIRKKRMEDIAKKVELVGKAPRTTWPTRLSKKLAGVGDDPNLRAEVENKEREKWLGRLMAQLRNGLRARGDAMAADQLSRRVGKGRRAGTLRKHVKVWDRFVGWLQATYEVGWPEGPAQVAAYLECRAAEPCGKSVPLSVVKTLMFMESAAEIEVNQQLGKSPAVKNAMEEVVLQLETVEPKARKQANLLPVSLVIALERVVMKRELPRFIRAYAWFRLFKIWGGLRFHDTLGVDFGSIRMDEYGLSCSLKRTKTTGPGKKVTIVKVFVGFGAHLLEDAWLEEGWHLWRAMAMENHTTQRDYFLQQPKDRDLENCSRKIANYSAAAAMSQALFKVLETADGEELMLEGVGCLWSEHSERVTLRTWAGASGVPEAVCKKMGRWTPTVDQAYDQSERMQVLRAQTHIGNFIRKNFNKTDPFDEEEVIRKVADVLQVYDRPNYEVAAQQDRLRIFQAGGRAPKRLRWEDGEKMERVVEAAVEDFSPGFASESEGDEIAAKPSDEHVPGETRMGHYVASVVGRSATKTLHRVGECFRQPGVHYREYTCYGDELPKASSYHRACKTCFPRNDGGKLEEDDSSGSEAVSSSSVSDSGEEAEEDM